MMSSTGHLTSNLRRILLAVALIAAPLTVTAQQYNFLVEPNYPPDRAKEVYRPLIEYLNQTTGFEFNLVTARNYHFYWADLRRDNDFHFVFDEAHFTDYRAQRFGYTPLVRSQEVTQYALLALDYDEWSDEGLTQLVGRSIVTMPAPSLGSAMLMELYPNPVQQPEIRSAASDWRDSVQIIFNGEADAAMVPVWLEQLYPNLISVQRSQEFPGAAVSAAPGVPDEVSQAVTEALLALHDNPDYYEVLIELNITRFERTNAAEYEGSEAVLQSFYGYR